MLQSAVLQPQRPCFDAKVHQFDQQALCPGKPARKSLSFVAHILTGLKSL